MTRMAVLKVLWLVLVLRRNVDAVVLGNVDPNNLPDPRIIILGSTGIRSNLGTLLSIIMLEEAEFAVCALKEKYTP